MSGKRAKISCFSHIKQNSIAEIVSTMESFLVAEMGFEPHDLRVMSPTSYQTAPLRDINGAGSRGRTGTRVESHGILSPGRLPIPPFRHIRSSVLPNYYSTYICKCQPFFLDFLKNPAIRLDNRAQMCYHYMRLS